MKNYRKDNKPYKSREWMFYQYHEQKKSQGDIAALCGLDQTTVLYWMRKLNVPTRTCKEAQNLPSAVARAREHAKKRVGPNSTSWNGGRFFNPDGYVLVAVPGRRDPRRGRTLYVFEHRAQAELMLGRPLAKGEVVHHVNGKRADNRQENLMIFANNSEHMNYHKKNRVGAP